MKISAYIITLNESKNIKQCIKSLSFCDEIVIIDSNSNDKTCLIAKKMGAKIIKQEFLGFGAQKQFGAKACKYNWVLNLDGDERISKGLKESILKIKRQHKKQSNQIKAYKMCRANFIGTTNIKHGGWYKDSKIRLFDRRFFYWDDALVHESVFAKNKKHKARLINNDIIHYAYKDIHHYTQTMDKYSSLGAKILFNNLDNKIKSNNYNKITIFLHTKILVFVKMAFKPIVKFIEIYIYKLGFLDGFYGFIIARTSAFNMFLKFCKLYELIIEQQSIKKLKTNLKHKQKKINNKQT